MHASASVISNFFMVNSIISYSVSGFSKNKYTKKALKSHISPHPLLIDKKVVSLQSRFLLTGVSDQVPRRGG